MPPCRRPDGTLEQRTKGTPQGGVISPLLANLFLHYAFDVWMRRTFPERPVRALCGRCHRPLPEPGGRPRRCWRPSGVGSRSAVWSFIRRRPGSCTARTTTGPGSTNTSRSTSSGYTFQPRRAKNRRGKFFVSFLPAISTKAAKAIRARPSATGGWRPPGTTNAWRTWRARQSGGPWLDELLRAVLPLEVCASPSPSERGPRSVGATEIQAVSTSRASVDALAGAHRATGADSCSSCGSSACGPRLECRSRMRREFHVRFCEGAGVRFPRATRLVVSRGRWVHVWWRGLKRGSNRTSG